MISVVTWKWTPFQGYRSKFAPETVNTLKRMVDRHYTDPHRFICVTDDPVGLDSGIEIVPAWNDYADLPSPSGGKNPSCYRRLRAFAPEMREFFGERFVSMDLDMVITGDLRPVWNRPEDFVIWGDTNPRTFYNGSMFLMTAGARSRVWTDFKPLHSPKQAHAAGHFGSDQGWISFCLGPGEAKWSTSDGVYSYRSHLVPQQGMLPENAKVVAFHGPHDPWERAAQALDWVREHYR